MLHNNGLTKLTEECGELVQAISKFITLKDERSDTLIHWDGSNVKDQLEDEMADVLAACYSVAENLGLDVERISNRKQYKKSLFRYWHQGGKETSVPWPENGKFSTADVDDNEKVAA